MSRYLSCVLIILCSVTGGYAQVSTGAILRTVTDPSGAVVPDAKVTLSNNGTGDTRTAQANANGEYIFNSLQAGQYSINATAPGF